MQGMKTLGFLFTISFCLAIMPVGAVETIQKADVILDQAKDLISKQKNATQAAELLETGVKQYPKDYRFWVTLGVAYEAMNELEKAISAYKTALEIKIVPGLSTRVLGLENKVVMGKAFQAFMLEEQKRTSRKLSSKELFEQAVKDRAEKKFDSAFQKYIECVSQDGTYLGINDRGIIKSALEYYQRRVRDKVPDSRYYLAIYYFFAGNFDEAIKGFQTFLREEPSSKLCKSAAERLKALEELKGRLKIANQALEAASKTAKIASPTTTSTSSTASGTGSVSSETAAVQKTLTITELSESKEAGDLFSEAREMKARKQMGKASALMQAALNKKADPDLLMEYADLNMELAKKGNPVGMNVAITAYREIMAKFPNSQLATEAKEKVLAMQPTPAKRGEEIDKHFEKLGLYPKETFTKPDSKEEDDSQITDEEDEPIGTGPKPIRKRRYDPQRKLGN